MFTLCEYSRVVLTTVEEIIEAVGGASAAASLGKVGPSAISNWKFRRRIPAEQYLVFSGALERAGKMADPSIFGLVPAEEAGT